MDPAEPQTPPSAGGTDSPAASPRRHIPNTLTALRVIIAATFVALMSFPNYTLAGADNRVLIAWGLGLFVVAALTDALDGYLARRWNVVSVFGRIMDPFADKVLVLGAFVMLAGPAFAAVVETRTTSDAEPVLETIQVTGVQPWMVVVILARDLLVTTLRGMVEGRGKSFAALTAGKIKMIVQSVGIPVILLTLAIVERPVDGAARWFVVASAWTVMLLTAWSAIPYCLDGYRKLTTP